MSLTISGTRTLTDDDAYYRSPTWSPDGQRIAALRSRVAIDPAGAPATEGDLVVFELALGQEQIIALPPAMQPERAAAPVLWQLDGEGVSFYYYDFASAQAVPFLVTYHLASGEVTSRDLCACSPIAFSDTGEEVLIADSPEGTFQLSWLNLVTGQRRRELSLPKENPRDHRYFGFALSADKHVLLMNDLDGNVFRYEIGSGLTPVAFLSSAASPTWSPGGNKLVFASLSAFNASYYYGQLMIANADGSSPEALFAENQPVGMLSPAWSPDGTQIAFLYGTRHSNAILIAEVPEALRP